uniref:Uncharacterized protein n=1 Tax=viral metagenome TaxID=1070528 RepID=A0A6M3Y1V3_9ZZZZ
MGILEWGKQKGVTHFLGKEEPEKWGEQVAQILNLLLDNEVGENRSELIQDKLEPWISRFTGALIKELRKI